MQTEKLAHLKKNVNRAEIVTSQDGDFTEETLILIENLRSAESDNPQFSPCPKIAGI
jgi:hypothetical protein